MDVSKKIGSTRVRTLSAVVLAFWGLSTCYTIYFTETYKFKDISDQSIENQWKNIEAVLVASRTHVVPLILFDIDILPDIFVSRSKAWQNTLHQCKVLCKYHPEEKNVITFAALATKFLAAKDEYIESLIKLGFTTHLSHVPDPKEHDKKAPTLLPSYLWLARNSHVIHITFLHDRGATERYLWAGPVTDTDWMDTVAAISPALGTGWHSMDAIGAKFPRYAQGYDVSHRFTGLPSYIDSHRVTVPYHIRAFLNEYANSRFYECNHRRSEKYRLKHLKIVNPYDRQFQVYAMEALAGAKRVLDKLDITFWLTGGTLLGWYRQCGIIPYDKNVEIGVWKHEYKDAITPRMKYDGYFLRSKFGRLEDGLEMAFLDGNNTRLNINFFSNEDSRVTHMRTRQEDGARFVYSYSPFALCWTEFVGMKVRVPCETQTYIETYFGQNWDAPDSEWTWHSSAHNVMAAGEWAREEWPEVIEIHSKPVPEAKQNVNDGNHHESTEE